MCEFGKLTEFQLANRVNLALGTVLFVLSPTLVSSLPLCMGQHKGCNKTDQTIVYACVYVWWPLYVYGQFICLCVVPKQSPLHPPTHSFLANANIPETQDCFRCAPLTQPLFVLFLLLHPLRHHVSNNIRTTNPTTPEAQYPFMPWSTNPPSPYPLKLHAPRIKGLPLATRLTALICSALTIMFLLTHTVTAQGLLILDPASCGKKKYI